MSLILLNSNYRVEKRADYSFVVYDLISKNIDYSWIPEISLDIDYSWETSIIPVSKNIDYSFDIYSMIQRNVYYSWNGYAFSDSPIENATGYEFKSNKRVKVFIGE